MVFRESGLRYVETQTGSSPERFPALSPLQAIVGDWHTCAMPVSVPPRSKIQERAEWDAWVASEVRGVRRSINGGGGAPMADGKAFLVGGLGKRCGACTGRVLLEFFVLSCLRSNSHR